MKFFSRFVDSNDRELRRLQPIVDEANELEEEIAALSDDEIRERFNEIREEIREIAEPDEPSEDERHHPDLERRRELAKARRKKENDRIQSALDQVAAEVFAMGREAMKRTLGMRQYDVQIMGGVVLHQGKIAEMKTGEGKTFIPTFAAVLNSLTGRGVHIVTVNDYLARRDPQWMGPVFHFLGVSVGMITHDESFVFEPGYPTTDERLINLRPVSRREAYAADITYGTNNEFGFDYLRDNMVTELDQRVQRERSFAIVDEVDNILIDEARTPLIISGQAEESADLYYTFARLVPRLKGRPEGEEEGGDFFVDLKDKAVSPTEEGVEKMEGFLGVENLYDSDPRLARHFEQALRAHALYKLDRDYIVKDGEIVIVDEFTGRQMPGRRWSEGLHQAIEAKEGVQVQRESVTLATITFQNYFRLYDKLAGMTGTAMTEAEEFHKIYTSRSSRSRPTCDMIRDDEADLVFRNEGSKFNSVIDEIAEMQEAGRPVLVGTISVEKSEILSTMLKRRGIKHETLNAKFHEKESGIVAQAGRTGAVTIATNMAGRGTDIMLGGDPAGLASEMLHKRGLNPAEVDKATYDAAFAEAKAITDEDHEKVVAVGGLHIIGTERHDSRRIDNQLRGRAGRQGDPGSSRFYLSLEDDLMKRFASDRVAGLMERMGLEDDVAIESRHRQQDDRERPEPGRGLQLRHAQARRRVRRRHQPPARDDLRGAQQGPPQRGPERHGPGLRRGRDRGARRQPPRPARAPTTGAWRRSPPRSRRWASTSAGHDRGRALGARRPRRDPRAPPRRWRTPSLEARGGRRSAKSRLGDGRAPRPAPDDRLAVGRAPDRDRRHAARHRPARLRPAGPAQRVPARGVPALRRAARPHPPPGRDDDLPRHRDPPAPGGGADDVRRQPAPAAPARLRANRGRGGRRGGRHGLRPRSGVATAGQRPAGTPQGGAIAADGRRPRRRIRWRGPGCDESTNGARLVGRREAGLHPDAAPGSAATTRAGAARA